MLSWCLLAAKGKMEGRPSHACVHYLVVCVFLVLDVGGDTKDGPQSLACRHLQGSVGYWKRRMKCECPSSMEKQCTVRLETSGGIRVSRCETAQCGCDTHGWRSAHVSVLT